MDLSHMGHLPLPDPFIGIVVDILWVGYLLIRFSKKLFDRTRPKSRGSLLLQIEVKGRICAHIAILNAQQRAGKTTYEWKMSQIAQEDFPYFAMTDLPFTHIRVAQKRAEGDLLTVSVVARLARLWNRDFYWIKNATIGGRPGFPRQLLLPHNFVLKYVDETTDAEAVHSGRAAGESAAP